MKRKGSSNRTVWNRLLEMESYDLKPFCWLCRRVWELNSEAQELHSFHSCHPIEYRFHFSIIFLSGINFFFPFPVILLINNNFDQQCIFYFFIFFISIVIFTKVYFFYFIISCHVYVE